MYNKNSNKRSLEETLQQVQGERQEKHSEAQQKIIVACKKPASIEDIVAATQLSFEQVQSEMFSLQLDEAVSQDFSGLWVSSF